MFGRVQKRSDAFGNVRTRSETFGLRSDAFGRSSERFRTRLNAISDVISDKLVKSKISERISGGPNSNSVLQSFSLQKF